MSYWPFPPQHIAHARHVLSTCLLISLLIFRDCCQAEQTLLFLL